MSQFDETTKMGRRKFLTMGGIAAASGGMLASINSAALAQAHKLEPGFGPAADGEPIPIGGGVPLTGWAAADGIEFKRALEMACDEINAMGGILGRPLVPVFEDRGGSVDLNRLRAFSKWFSASVMPPPLWASAG